MIIRKEHTNITCTDDILRSLLKMGWGSHFQTHLDNICNEKVFPARVVGVQKNSFLISQGNSESLVTAAGKLNHQKEKLFPVTGDWVLVNDKVISVVLPRKNILSRGAAGTHGKQGSQSSKEQIMAANLDTVFIVCGLHQNPEHCVYEVETVAFEVPVHCILAKDSIGLASLEPYLSQGRTIAMVGSSGSGKSTSESVGKGKHTTTSRSLIMIPQGGMVIDNPGIREIGFWDDGGGLNVAFPEIENLANTCRFHDCSHIRDPGCQVLHGLTTGAIRKDRLDSYQKMKRELAYLSDRQTKSAGRVEKERWKEVSLKIKAINNRRTNHA